MEFIINRDIIDITKFIINIKITDFINFIAGRLDKMNRVFSNKLKCIEDRLNKSDKANHIVMISANTIDNGYKWEIIDNYYLTAGNGKQKKVYSNDYKEYLGTLNNKVSVIIDDI